MADGVQELEFHLHEGIDQSEHQPTTLSTVFAGTQVARSDFMVNDVAHGRFRPCRFHVFFASLPKVAIGMPHPSRRALGFINFLVSLFLSLNQAEGGFQRLRLSWLEHQTSIRCSRAAHKQTSGGNLETSEPTSGKRPEAGWSTRRFLDLRQRDGACTVPPPRGTSPGANSSLGR